MNVDCDLYAPTKAALEFFYRRLARGGILFLHDYASGIWPGVGGPELLHRRDAEDGEKSRDVQGPSRNEPDFLGTAARGATRSVDAPRRIEAS